MSDNIIKPDILFETSWEVCNKVGGIYTVLSSKAKVLGKQLGDKLIFIGPDVWDKENPSPFFKESNSILKEWMDTKKLPNNIKVRVGRWNIPGNPIAILVKFESIYSIKNAVYTEMWENFKVDSLHAYGDYDEGCAFGIAAAMVIDSCAAYLAKRNDKIVAHFDEWTTGMGLLYLKLHSPKIATVFTTHATSIGRSICGNNKPLYDYFKGYNGDQMAAELNMQSKHSLEKAAAHNADCFTTVSEITARECEQLLEKRPDIVTPNGFELAFVPKAKNFDIARKNARSTLLNVASSLIGKRFSDDTFMFLTSGRNEFRNKGLDMYLDAVNHLRNGNPGKIEKETIAFVMVPAWSAGPRKDLQSIIENKNQKTVIPPLEDPVITHTLHNYSQDTIYNRIQYLGMHNASYDKVNIIYVPCYLNGDDGIFNKTYYELLIGMDATVFASYYEPWGYTPHEGIAFGVPTITTNLSGFGQWVLESFGNDIETTGVKVIKRTDSNYYSAVMDISTIIYELMQLKPAKLKQISKAAISTSKKADWNVFINYYEKAYTIAINNKIKN